MHSRRQALLGGATALVPGTALAWTHGKGLPPAVAAPTFVLATPVPDQGHLVGTVSATGSPTSFAITAGDPNGNFQIDNTGIITVTNAGMNNLNSGTQTLTVAATNFFGTGSNSTTVNFGPVPVVTAATFSFNTPVQNAGTVVGTVVASNNPTTFAETAGDPNNNFAIDNSGVITVTANGVSNLTTGVQTLTITASNQFGTSAGVGIQINFTSQSGSYLIYKAGVADGYVPSGSAYWVALGTGNGTNVGPNGTVTQGQAQYKFTASGPQAGFPNGTTLHHEMGTGSGSITGFTELVFGAQADGQFGTPGYPRPSPPNPAPTQLANFTTLTAIQDFTVTGQNFGNLIYDPWFEIPGSMTIANCTGDSRTHEFDVGINIPFGGSDQYGSMEFGTALRLFKMTTSNLWDGYPLMHAEQGWGWRFITGNLQGKFVGTLNLMNIWRQMIWTGSATGNEWSAGINLGVEPEFAGVMDIVINNYAITSVNHANITVTAGGSVTRPGNAGYHIVGAGVGQNSTVDYRPTASTAVSIKRGAGGTGGKVLVRSNNDVATQDQIEGCDKLQFSDGIKTISSLPVIDETPVTIPLPYTTNRLIRQLKATNAANAWSIISGNNNGYVALDNATGNLTLTAAGVSALSPALFPSYSTGLSFFGSASPGVNIRTVFGSAGYLNRANTLNDNQIMWSNQLSVNFATTSAHTAGTLDSMWIGISAGAGNPNFQTGTAIQATFGGATSLNLAAGAQTYVSDPVPLLLGKGNWLCVHMHVTGSGARLVQGSPANTGTYWVNGADLGTGAMTGQSASGNMVVGITRPDCGSSTWIDLEVKATNTSTGHAGVGFITVGTPIHSVFNSSNASANIVLSNNKTTATANVASNGDMAVTNTGRRFYKNYVEFKINRLDGAGSAGGGLVHGETLTNTVIGSTVNSIGCFDTGVIRMGNAQVGTLGVSAGVNDVICMAMDFDGAVLNTGVVDLTSKQYIWFRINNGNWNGNASADPSLGIGGIDAHGVARFTLPGTSGNCGTGGSVGGGVSYAAAWVKKVGTNGAQVTMNCGNQPFAFVPPAGFWGWRWQ